MDLILPVADYYPEKLKNTKKTLEELSNVRKTKAKLEKSKVESKNQNINEVQRIKELENERKRIDLDQTCIFDNSMNNRINEINKMFNKRKEKINKLYEYNEPEPKFEYTKEEKERRQKDINEIRKLNTYSKHPCFNKMVNYFGLDDYL